MAMVMMPLTKKMPKIQDASSAGVRCPAVPTERMIAVGPVAAKSRPMKPLVA